MTVTYHPAIVQGSDEWLALRCGLLTASEMKHILTPKLSMASNDKERQHLYDLLAQRVTGYVEPHYVSDDMLRGHEDEILARDVYAQHHAPAPLAECGFITNDKFGFTIGYSPDALVGDDGLLEAKSRRQKYQVETIIAHTTTGEIPADFLLQCHTGILVSERKWLDLATYCGGLPMYVMRVYPDKRVQEAIVTACGEFEKRLAMRMGHYRAALKDYAGKLTPTERRVEQEMMV